VVSGTIGELMPPEPYSVAPRCRRPCAGTSHRPSGFPPSRAPRSRKTETEPVRTVAMSTGVENKSAAMRPREMPP
jgi:hypothetical protein